MFGKKMIELHIQNHIAVENEEIFRETAGDGLHRPGCTERPILAVVVNLKTEMTTIAQNLRKHMTKVAGQDVDGADTVASQQIQLMRGHRLACDLNKRLGSIKHQRRQSCAFAACKNDCLIHQLCSSVTFRAGMLQTQFTRLLALASS